MPNEPTHVDRLVAALAYEYQRQQTLAEPARGSKRRRPKLMPAVDMAELAHLSDKEAARQIAVGGPPWPDLAAVTDRIADERAGVFGDPAQRCQTGLLTWFGLQCQYPALPGEQWCRHHHPDPPARGPVNPRLSPWELKARPDGDVIAALYRVEDRLGQMEQALVAAVERLNRAEDRAAPVGALTYLSTAQAAEYLGVSVHTMYNLRELHRLPYTRVGRHLRYKISDLDDWLQAKSVRAVRR